jgi:glucose/arabinose dehydrogenase
MADNSQNHSTGDSVLVPEGFSLQPLATGLNFPTAIAFSEDKTQVWVSESGALPGTQPRIVQLDPGGDVTPVLSGDQFPEGILAGPITDVTFHDGAVWLTHRQTGANGWLVGAISKFDPADPAGTFTTVLTNLPSAGDHYAEEILFDEAGRAYFAQGTATNSSVVGPDNELVTGWLTQFPDFHDFPAQDVVLNGTEFHAPVAVPGLNPENQVTAPFRPFGSGPIAPGTTVPAATPDTPQERMIAGNGAIYSFDPNTDDSASTLRLEAWGLRNPFGIGFDPSNPDTLFATDNGADIRSARLDGELRVVESRPIANDFDDLFTLTTGGTAEFFGFPDFFHDPADGSVLPVTDPLFAQGELPIPPPGFVLDETFRNSLAVEPAVAQFELHSSANKFDFSPNAHFGSEGNLFVAETGSFVPVTGAQAFVGYKVVQVDPDTGQVSDFIVNTGDTPEEIFEPTGFNKPIDVKFQDGTMFVVDFGVYEPGLDLAQANTGKVWTVSPPTPEPPDDGADLLAKAFTFLVGEGLDLLRPYQLNPEGTGPAAPESPAVLEAAEETDTFVALLTPANDSGVLGAALVHFDEKEGDVTIAVRASGLTPNEVHPQHIHGFEDDRPSLIPTIALDQDLDGFVEGPEAGPVYGPVLLAATASGEVSREAVSEDFPRADENGNLSFIQTYDFNPNDADDAFVFEELQDRLAGRLFQIHGIELKPGEGEGTDFEVMGSGGYIPELGVANGVLLPLPIGSLSDWLLA